MYITGINFFRAKPYTKRQKHKENVHVRT